MPSTEEILLEIELAASSPERVFDWLKARAEKPYDESFQGGEEVERSLLSRESDLINLGLARYGFSSGIVRKLFSGSFTPKSDLHLDLGPSRPKLNIANALRLGALSNRTLMKRGLLERMPTVLFGSDSWNFELIRDFVTTAGADEVYAMFRNPTIHGDVLARLYAKESPFDLLTDERWKFLITATIGNRRLEEEYSGPMDGWAEFMHERVFAKAWELAERAPVTDEWANLLLRLLETVSPVYSRKKEKMGVIERWRLSVGSETADPSDPFSGGYLDNLGAFRVFLVRLLPSSDIDLLKDHQDVALRCGFYERGDPTREELLEAYAREPELLLKHALRNDAVWMRRETRETLRTLCWEECRTKEDDTLQFPNAYKKRCDQLDTEHPEWFAEGHHEEAGKHQTDLENSLEALRAGQVSILDHLASFDRMPIYFWVAVFILEVTLFRRC
jgi:hypothetical protein